MLERVSYPSMLDVTHGSSFVARPGTNHGPKGTNYDVE